MVVENTLTRGTSEITVGHTAIMDTKGQPEEQNPMAIKTKLQSKPNWEAAPEDVIHPPDRNWAVENKIVN